MFLSIIFYNDTFIDLGFGEPIFVISTQFCGKSYFHKTPFWIRTQISDHARATNIGRHEEKEVQTIAEWIKCELEANFNAPSDTHRDKILEEALVENIGPSFVLHQVSINYARLGTMRP